MMTSVMGIQKELSSTLHKTFGNSANLGGHRAKALQSPHPACSASWALPGPASSPPHRLTTSTSPLAPSLSTTYQGSRKPPMLALWPKVYRNQPVETVSR